MKTIASKIHFFKTVIAPLVLFLCLGVFSNSTMAGNTSNKQISSNVSDGDNVVYPIDIPGHLTVVSYDPQTQTYTVTCAAPFDIKCVTVYIIINFKTALVHWDGIGQDKEISSYTNTHNPDGSITFTCTLE
jgi:hypothetical protein